MRRLAACTAAALVLPVPTARAGELPLPTPGLVYPANTAWPTADGWFGVDTLHDDRGADFDGMSTITDASTGDSRYPQGESHGDIQFVRAARTGDRVRITVTLTALTDSSAPAVFVGLDVAPDGFDAWPHGAGASSPGIDAGYTLLTTEVLASGPAPVGFATSLEENTMVLELAGASVPDRFEIIVGGGFWDPGARTWGRPYGLTGLALDPPRVFDLALGCTPAADNRDDAYCEEQQARVIAAHDVSPAWQTVDLSAPAQPMPRPTGYVSFVFRSALERGEGIVRNAYTHPVYVGEWQSFTAAVPPRALHERVTLAVFLHGQAAQHSLQAHYTGYRDRVHKAGVLVLYPEGRGASTWYLPIGEVDVLEALAAVESLYLVDPDRVFMTGISMGGYGAYRLAYMYPDLWAGVITYMAVNLNEYGTPDNTVPLEHTSEIVGNGTNLPHLMLAGTEQTYHEMALRRSELAQAGVEHTMKTYAEYVHGILFPFDVDRSARDWILSAPSRARNPRHVSYRGIPSWLDKDANIYHAGASLLRRDRAYWASGLSPSDAAKPFSVDATSDGIPERVRAREDFTRLETTEETREGHTPETPYLFAVAEGTALHRRPAPTSLRARLALENLAEVTLDLARMGIAAPGARIRVATDGPAAVGLGSVPPGVTVLLDGNPAPNPVPVPSGMHVISLRG